MNEARMSRSAALIIVLSETTLETGRRRTGSSSGEGAPFLGVLRGLCVNCDLRRDCTYPKPLAGVWNCDEYV